LTEIYKNLVKKKLSIYIDEIVELARDRECLEFFIMPTTGRRAMNGYY